MTAPATEKAAPIPAENAPYCAGAVAHIDIGGLCESHVEELRRHAAKLHWQMENDERPAPPHGWTCFHCAQTFTTWASASAHFGDDPRGGRPECCADRASQEERIREDERDRLYAILSLADLPGASKVMREQGALHPADRIRLRGGAS